MESIDKFVLSFQHLVSILLNIRPDSLRREVFETCKSLVTFRQVDRMLKVKLRSIAKLFECQLQNDEDEDSYTYTE